MGRPLLFFPIAVSFPRHLSYLLFLARRSFPRPPSGRCFYGSAGVDNNSPRETHIRLRRSSRWDLCTMLFAYLKCLVGWSCRAPRHGRSAAARYRRRPFYVHINTRKRERERQGGELVARIGSLASSTVCFGSDAAAAAAAA